jgi:PAS domain S-box-containing protein
MTDSSLSKTILLVEENKDFNPVLSGVLKDAGYYVERVYRAEDAVKQVSENDDINLILMNIDPSSGMDGAEAARIILSSKTLPVIFIASVLDNPVMDRIRGITRYGFYIKNSGEHLLLSSVDMAFELFEIDKKRCEILTEETDYKKSEKIIAARLRLVEYSLNHSLDEVLQKTLDEVTEISESPIGFYHFVGDDEKTLNLQGWSTRTMKEFCKAAGKGSHYGVELAGVWADAVRERRPLIHNDYASLPNRKGLPEGHAPVIRELVVPIFRNDKIVAILGVGNKHSDYTENDIQIVSFFADVAWEIAEKKRSAEALAEREKNYRLMFDTANEAIIIAQDGVIKFMNNKTIELFGGYSEEEIATRPFINFIHPDDRTRVINNYVKRISGEQVETRYPFRAVVFGGVVKWVEVNSVLTEWNGKPATMNFYNDITERKRVEEELKKSELFARATLDALSTNIAILDENGIIIAVNRAWREFALNNSMDISGSCEGINYLEVCDSSDGNDSEEARPVADGIREIISGNQREFSLEYPCHSPEEKRWFNMLVTRFEYNGAIRVVVAHENITKRKLVESELRSLSYVVEQSPVSIVITDTNGSIKYVNPAAEKTTGYSRDELLGNNPRVLKSDHIKGDEYRVLWETITSGKYWKGEFHNIRKDGTMYWESATISPIFDENGDIEQFAAVKEDITERKSAEEKIQNLLIEKELILKEVHHRIKNNMNTIKGLLYLQAIEMKDTAAAVALHEAENRVQSMMILYDKLYSSHDYQVMSVRSYLGPLVDEILGNFANHSIVKVEKHVADFTLDANIVFPLGIIVNELLTNIMKYAFTGRDSGVITLSAEKNESMVTISLGDNGKGIPESINFESSTGFGLNLVGMLTAQMGGSIRIERGDGTKFVLEFMVSEP